MAKPEYSNYHRYVQVYARVLTILLLNKPIFLNFSFVPYSFPHLFNLELIQFIYSVLLIFSNPKFISILLLIMLLLFSFLAPYYGPNRRIQPSIKAEFGPEGFFLWKN